MRRTVFFVCAANVCRSPLMQYTFLESISAQGGWQAESGGVTAPEGRRMCEEARSLVQAASIGRLADEHRSTPIEEFAFDTADIVIAASRSERSTLALLAPHARSRIFTLSEAVLLGRYALAHPASARGIDTENCAERLDAQRGMLVIPRASKPRRYLSPVPRSHPFDIADAHHLRRGRHRTALRRVQAETREFAEQLMTFFEASGTSPAVFPRDIAR